MFGVHHVHSVRPFGSGHLLSNPEELVLFIDMPPILCHTNLVSVGKVVGYVIANPKVTPGGKHGVHSARF